MKLTVKEINVLLDTLDIQIEGFRVFIHDSYQNGDVVNKDDLSFYKSLLKLRKKFEKCEVFINKGVKHGKR